jgi:hypothetical protein
VAVRHAGAAADDMRAEAALARRRREVLRAVGLNDGPRLLFDPNLGAVELGPQDEASRARLDQEYEAQRSERQAEARRADVNRYRARLAERWALR